MAFHPHYWDQRRRQRLVAVRLLRLEHQPAQERRATREERYPLAAARARGAGAAAGDSAGVSARAAASRFPVRSCIRPSPNTSGIDALQFRLPYRSTSTMSCRPRRARTSTPHRAGRRCATSSGSATAVRVPDEIASRFDTRGRRSGRSDFRSDPIIEGSCCRTI